MATQTPFSFDREGMVLFQMDSFSTLSSDGDRHGPTVRIGDFDWNLFVRKLVDGDGVEDLQVGIRCQPSYTTQQDWAVTAMYTFTIFGLDVNMFFNTNVEVFQPRGHHKIDVVDLESVRMDYATKDDKIFLKGIVKIIPVSFGSPFTGLRKNLSNQVVQRTPFFQRELMMNLETMADVRFKVGSDKTEFFVQSAILGASSLVFSTMMFPSKKSEFEKGMKEIELSDVPPSVFKTILQFVHKREVVVNRTMIEPLLDFIEKYDIMFLAESLKTLVIPDTVLDFFPFVVNRIGMRHVLWESVWEVIDNNFSVIADKDEFLELSSEELKHILERNSLKVKEIEVYNAYLKWADYQCLEVTDANRRQVMSDINLIRFPCMTNDEFLFGPADSDILTDKEKVELFKYMSQSNNHRFKTSFITTCRANAN